MRSKRAGSTHLENGQSLREDHGGKNGGGKEKKRVGGHSASKVRKVVA